MTDANILGNNLQPGKVTLVIVLFDSDSYLADLKSSILNSASEIANVLLINNGPPGDVDWLAEQLPFASVEQNAENVGHAAGLLQALASVTTQYVIICDHDTQWEPGTITRLISGLATAPDTTWAISPAVKQQRSGETETQWSVGLFGTVCRSNNVGGDTSQLVKSVYAPTTFLLVDLYRHRPEIEPRYFVYWNDVDMLFQAATVGKQIVIDASCVVTHGDGTSISSRRAAAHPTRAFLQTRNRWLFSLSRLEARTLFLAAPAMVVAELGNLVYLCQHGMPRVAFRAYRSLWSSRKLIRDIRSSTRSSRTVDDYHLLGPCVGLGANVEEALGNGQRFALLSLRWLWSRAHERLRVVA